MKSLIVAGVVLTGLLLSVMLGKTRKLLADRYLIIYLLFAMLWQAYLYAESDGVLQNSYWMLLGKGIYLLHAPFFFLYLYSLTQQKHPSGKIYLILFTPFIAYTIHFLYYYVFVFDHAQLLVINGLLEIDGEVSFSWMFFVLLFLLIEPVYLFWFYLLLRRYRMQWQQSISSNEGIEMQWLQLLFYIWLVNAILLVPVSIVVVTNGWISAELLQLLIEIASVVFFFIVGFYGFKQTTVFTNLVLTEVTEKKITPSYERSGLTSAQAKEFQTRLLVIMDKEKPYLIGELNAADLSQMAGITVNHLSQVLNQQLHQNFFDFVNGYRVKEVIQKMKDPDYRNFTLLALALESGFNSKTSFNTIFKKVTRQTPSQYYKEIIKGL